MKNPAKEKTRARKSESRSADRSDGTVKRNKRKRTREREGEKENDRRSKKDRKATRIADAVEKTARKRSDERAEPDGGRKRQKKRRQVERTEDKRERGKKSSTVRADITRWKNGEPFANIAKERGVTPYKLKQLFIKKLGSEEKYERLKKKGAGGKAFGGKKSKGRKSNAAIQAQDDDAPRIKSAKMNDGWKTEYVYAPRVVTIEIKGLKHHTAWRELVATIYHSPDGKQYVTAQPNEKADAVYTGTKKHGLPPVRLKLYEDSRARELVSRQERIHAHADEQEKVKKEKKVRAKTMTPAEITADAVKQGDVVAGKKRKKKVKKVKDAKVLKRARKDSFKPDVPTLKRRKKNGKTKGSAKR